MCAMCVSAMSACDMSVCAMSADLKLGPQRKGGPGVHLHKLKKK